MGLFVFRFLPVSVGSGMGSFFSNQTNYKEMLQSEFIERTGLKESEYVIANFLYESLPSEWDKDKFCKEYVKERNNPLMLAIANVLQNICHIHANDVKELKKSYEKKIEERDKIIRLREENLKYTACLLADAAHEEINEEYLIDQAVLNSSAQEYFKYILDKYKLTDHDKQLIIDNIE